MRTLHGFLAFTLVVSALGCSSGYGKPASSPPNEVYARDGEPEQRLVVDQLVEFGKSFPLRYRPKGTGHMAISPVTITWTNDDDEDRSFSLRADVVRSVTMQCVERAGGNICLELVLDTFTGLSYRFRDIDWAGGYNQRVRHVHDHLKANFPSIQFSENTVDDIG